METNFNTILQIFIGGIIVLPFILFIMSRIGYMERLNQNNFDTWRQLCKNRK